MTGSVLGESNSVNRLRPENFDAFLDVSSIDGDYEERITVTPPQNINLLAVSPESAIGTIEGIRTITLPVEVALYGTMPDDAVVSVVAEPAEVVVRGRQSTLERLTKAIALFGIQEETNTLRLYAVDDEGRPVSEVALEPSTVTTKLTAESVLHTKEVGLSLSLPEVAGLNIEGINLNQSTLTVAGSEQSLTLLEDVTAELVLVNINGAGEYSLEAKPQLPEGVLALETITALLVLSEPPANPSSTNGESDDPARSTLRRPDSTQDSAPSNELQ